MTPTPQERREVALGSVVRVISGFAFEAQRFGETGDIPIVRIRDVVRGRSATYYSGPYDSRFLVNDGDLLVGMDGDFNRARWKGGKALLNQRVCRLEPTDERLDADYLYHFLQPALSKIHDETPYATVKHLSSKTIAAIGIPLPPLPEQRRIAAILDAADALRAKRRATIAALDTLTQSIFLDMFGDPGSNPKGWQFGKIGDIIDSAQYGTSAKAGSAGEVPVLRMNNITRTGDIDLTDLKYLDLTGPDMRKYLLRPGDVLFNRTNSPELVGKSAIFRGGAEMAFAGYLIRVRTARSNDPEYLAAFLNSRYAKAVLRNMCKSIIGMANINAQELRTIKIPLPPTELQHSFALAVAGVERAKARPRESLEALDSLFASLQSQAFRGEL